MTEIDLGTRLLAAIDVKEAKARAAGGEPWTTTGPDTIAEWSIYDTQWMVASATAYDHDQPMSSKPGARGPGYIDPNANAIHIADNDPADVLRRCAADRKILRLHGVGMDGGKTMAHECAYVADGMNHHDVWISYERTCETIRLLAEGYGITEGDESG